MASSKLWTISAQVRKSGAIGKFEVISFTIDASTQTEAVILGLAELHDRDVEYNHIDAREYSHTDAQAHRERLFKVMRDARERVIAARAYRRAVGEPEPGAPDNHDR